jgi:N-acetylglucosamine kinase-like BadF-type ATPase
MMRYFLGVDVGNTKSHALICDEEGTAVGFGIGGSGNHESIGKEAFQNLLLDIVNQAITSSKISRKDIAAAGFGIAGFDWSEDTPMMREIIDSLGLNAPYRLMNDSGPGLFAGSNNGWGVSVAAGTGVNARGRDRHGKMARMTGHGALFGEVGGGGALVRRAFGDISRAWSMRGKPTKLTELFVAQLGADGVEDLMAGVTRDRYHLHADLALTVFQAASDGDEVAMESIRWLGCGLGDLACGIIRQLGIEDEEFDVVLSGNLYKGSPVIQEAMREVVHQLAPCARFLRVSAPSVTSAVMMAMAEVGVDYAALRPRIIQSGEDMIGDSLTKRPPHAIRLR